MKNCDRIVCQIIHKKFIKLKEKVIIPRFILKPLQKKFYHHNCDII